MIENQFYLQLKLLAMIKGSSNMVPTKFKHVSVTMKIFKEFRKILNFTKTTSKSELKNVLRMNKIMHTKPTILSLKHSVGDTGLN